MSAYWSYLLTVVGVCGLWLVGRKDKRGFAIGVGAQLLWIGYATFTHQWGFYVSALAYGWVNVKNLRAWRAAEKQDAKDAAAFAAYGRARRRTLTK